MPTAGVFCCLNFFPVYHKDNSILFLGNSLGGKTALKSKPLRAYAGENYPTAHAGYR